MLMHFSQKAFLCNRTEFSFGEKLLETTVDDGRLRVSFNIPYNEIGTKRSVKSFPEKAFSRLGFALLAAAVASFALAKASNPYGLSTAMLLTLGAALLLMLFGRYARFDATRIPLATGNTILVFHDSQHYVIVGEIYRRRKMELLRLHGEVDPLNHPELERKKFLWLKEEGIIGEPEFEEALHKLAILAKPHPGS